MVKQVDTSSWLQLRTPGKILLSLPLPLFPHERDVTGESLVDLGGTHSDPWPAGLVWNSCDQLEGSGEQHKPQPKSVFFCEPKKTCVGDMEDQRLQTDLK